VRRPNAFQQRCAATMKQTRAYEGLRGFAHRAMAAAMKRGANPAWFDHRAIRSEPLDVFCQRRAGDERVRCERVHERKVFAHALPRNVTDRNALPNDRGWWGYSFRDVPARESGDTLVATLPNCRILPRIDAKGEFWVTVLTDEGTSLALREMTMRPLHAEVLRTAASDTIPDAVWVVERVYDNYAHWFTAHMPKLLLLRERGLAARIVMPARRPRFIDDSLVHFGFDPGQFRTFDPNRVIKARSLTVMQTDRFRPDLLRRVRSESPMLTDSDKPHRRVFISRQAAARRRLVNEAEIWPLLEQRGFERVHMEALSFAEQVRLMQETAILCAPHGAGLTNMMFCAAGTHIIEMADLSFPNPNFCAVAAAMDLPYWLVSSEGIGETHPLEKDLRTEPGALMRVVDQAIDALGTG
jgi:hypothetical protein